MIFAIMKHAKQGKNNKNVSFPQKVTNISTVMTQGIMRNGVYTPSTEELEKVKKLLGLNWSDEKIAILLKLELSVFQVSFAGLLSMREYFILQKEEQLTDFLLENAKQGKETAVRSLLKMIKGDERSSYVSKKEQASELADNFNPRGWVNAK
ncbi:hypothetical protein [Bartonella sp. DGB1]|uniref:hypothetical protein n=1 Tax=Bartonella sp. DGB1 TaxID=3239807 RepID=UPI003524642F